VAGLRSNPATKYLGALVAKCLSAVVSLRTTEEQNLAKWRELMFENAARYGQSSGAAPLLCLSASRIGGPQDIWERDGHLYTSSLLYYYMRYAYVCRFFDFESGATIVELGSGSGKQAEVLAKLHPGLALYLFDIPPQLYVAHQYLSALFPDRLVDYRSTRGLENVTELAPGAICVLGNWQFALLRTIRPDLFWSAASLAEMEPHVVAGYLGTVNASSENAYLMQNMAGSKKARRVGQPGVLEPTVFSHYQSGLPDFRVIDRSPSYTPAGERMIAYEDSFWRRQAR
jgi:putative sugar O-methyltransferase